MNNPLVSVIIPTYNRAHLIGETLDSVLDQTYKNWECIIVDDGSVDSTEGVVSSYVSKDSRFQLHHRPTDRLKGANSCRNYGFEKSKGEYIMFLDSDDICEPFCLLERVSKMTKVLTIDVLIRDTSLLIASKKNTFTVNKDPEINSSENYLRMFLSYEIPWPIMGCFYKKSILINLKFDENLKRFQDVSFNIKVLSQTPQVKISRDFKIDTYYRVDEAKVFKNNFVGNMLEALNVFYEIHWELLNNENYKSDLRKFSCKIILEFVVPYFNVNKKEANKLFRSSLQSKLYTFRQKVSLFSLMVLLNIKIFNSNGIGMNKFRGNFKHVINN